MSIESQRRARREYMRRFRALPANRRREIERERVRRADKILREIRLHLDPRDPRCAFCDRRPRTQVDRLVVAADGSFIPQKLPYCGVC